MKGKPLFNARADKAATTPSFRDAVKYRRCLVPMDGWYEWLVQPDPSGAKSKVVKHPYFMSAADGSRLYMAACGRCGATKACPRPSRCCRAPS